MRSRQVAVLQRKGRRRGEGMPGDEESPGLISQDFDRTPVPGLA
jgi:hypothetical protein